MMTGNVVAAIVGTSLGTTVGVLIVHRHTWPCWLFGHVEVPAQTWRWVHRTDDRGGAVMLGPRARRRAQEASKRCRRCGHPL